MASKAYNNQPMRNEAAYTAFIQGIHDLSIKTKVLESDVNNFTEAVQLAERLERVSKSLNASEMAEHTPIFAIQGKITMCTKVQVTIDEVDRPTVHTVE